MSFKQNPWLIIGLGNKGKSYVNTRHNYGFLCVDRYVEKRGGTSWRHRLRYDYALIDKGKIICAKPRTMMNLSGAAVMVLMEKFNVPPERTVLFHDDLDFPLGKVRIRKKGGSGGHKGIASIITITGSDRFPRIRFGIGKSENIDTVRYVLEKFSDRELEIVEKTLTSACEITDLIVQGKIEQAMNAYN